uniref:DUF6598 domain-containing protein n=1 Tax=Oryza nivara TaxID=4536 RepID=A0A0E0IK77_ORYNI
MEMDTEAESPPTTSKPQPDEEEEADLEEEEKQEPKPPPVVERVWTMADIDKGEGFLRSIGKTAEEYAVSKASRPRRRMETAEEWEAKVRKNVEEQNKAYEETIRSQDEDESNLEAIQYIANSGTMCIPLIMVHSKTPERNLLLVGPTRAIVLSMPEPVIVDVELKVKGTTESEDKHLSYLAVPLLCHGKRYSRMLLNSGSYTSKLSTLEFRLGYIVSSVEATIFVRVICGSWPDDFRGQFAAFTTGVRWKDLASEKNIAGVDDERILLLDSRGDQKVVVTGDDGKIVLSRCVVSVEDKGELKVHVRAWKVDDSFVEAEMVFTALKAGLSNGELDMGFCKLGVSVAWSLISRKPVYADSVM